jgi:hypothetical protein
MTSLLDPGASRLRFAAGNLDNRATLRHLCPIAMDAVRGCFDTPDGLDRLSSVMPP